MSIARFSRSSSPSLSRPTRAPSLDFARVVILSTIQREVARKLTSSLLSEAKLIFVDEKAADSPRRMTEILQKGNTMDHTFTRIAIILDRSGSMSGIKEATVSGFNEFVGKLKSGPGKVRLKLVQFDDEYEIVFDLPLEEAPVLTSAMFVPRGTTALLDAMGRTIGALGEELAGMPEAARPGQVIVMTMTDGLENASQYYSRAQIAAMVAHQQAVYRWQFMYLGANQDAIGVAADLGISGSASMNYKANRRAVAATFAACASAVDVFASQSLIGVPESLSFRLEDREAAMVDGEDEASLPESTGDYEAQTTGAGASGMPSR